MILVTGATGTVGTALMHALRERSDVVPAVRDVQRHPDGRAFDFAVPGTWGPALAGVRAIFLLLPPGLPQARQRFAELLAQAKRAGVERAVFLSVRNADRLSFLPHRGLEQVLEESGLGWTHIRPNDWMQNFATQPIYRDSIRAGELWAAGGRSRTSYIDVRDVAEVAAKALDGGFDRRALSLTGPAELTLYDVAYLLTKVLGRTVRYREPSLAGFVAHARRAGAPWPLALVMTSIGLIARLGYASGVDRTVEEVLGRPPRSFEAFARDYRIVWSRPR